jgi:hypothetical protein
MVGKSDLFWLIGYKDHLDFIIVGEGTGPYNNFPEKRENPRGKFHYIFNFISQHFENNKELVVISEQAHWKCPYLDELNRSSISGGPFERFEDIFEPMRDLIVKETTRRYLQKIPKDSLKYLIKKN